MLKIAGCQDQIAKGRSLGIKCARVSLLDINIDGFSSAKLFLHRRCMTAFRYEIPRNFILPVKIIVGLVFFLRVPGWKRKICRDQSRLTFSSRGFALPSACSQAR